MPHYRYVDNGAVHDVWYTGTGNGNYRVYNEWTMPDGSVVTYFADPPYDEYHAGQLHGDRDTFNKIDPADPHPPEYLYERPPDLPGVEFGEVSNYPQRNGPLMHQATDQYGNEWIWGRGENGSGIDISYYDKDGLKHEVYERDGDWYDKWTDENGTLRDFDLQTGVSREPNPDLPPYLQLQDSDPTNPQGPWTWDNPLKHWGDYGPTVTTLGGEGNLGWETGLMDGDLGGTIELMDGEFAYEAHYTATDQYGRKWDWYQADDGTSRIGYTDEAGQWHETYEENGNWWESFKGVDGNTYVGKLDPLTGTADRSYTDSSGINHDEVYAPPGWGNDDNRLVDIDEGAVDWATLVKAPPEGGNVPAPEGGDVPPGTETPEAEQPSGQPAPAGDGDGGYLGLGEPYVDFFPAFPMVKDPITGQWRNAEAEEIPGPEAAEPDAPDETAPPPGQTPADLAALDPNLPGPAFDPAVFVDRILETVLNDPEVLRAVADARGLRPEQLKTSLEEVTGRTPGVHGQGDGPDSPAPATWDPETAGYVDPTRLGDGQRIEANEVPEEAYRHTFDDPDEGAAEAAEPDAAAETTVDPKLLDPTAPGPTIDPDLLDPEAPGPTIDPALLDPAAPGPTIDPNMLDPNAPGPTVDPATLDPAAPGPTVDPATLDPTFAEPRAVPDPALADPALTDPSLAPPPTTTDPTLDDPLS